MVFYSKMKYPLWVERNSVDLYFFPPIHFFIFQMQKQRLAVYSSELQYFLYSNHQLRNGSQSKKGCLILDVKLFIHTYVGNLSFYHTQDFTITVLLHHIETSGTELFRNMSFYSVIIVVLCLLCISDLYLTLPVCLDKKTSFKPQLPSVSLILPQLRKKDRFFSSPSATAATYTLTVHTQACLCAHVPH